MKNSPVGKLMVRILADCPEMNFEQARAEAGTALLRIGGANRLGGAFKRWQSTKRVSNAGVSA